MNHEKNKDKVIEKYSFTYFWTFYPFSKIFDQFIILYFFSKFGRARITSILDRHLGRLRGSFEYELDTKRSDIRNLVFSDPPSSLADAIDRPWVVK